MPYEPTDDADAFETRVQQVLRALAEREDIDVPADELELAVREVLTELREAPVQDFVSLLAERKVRERLRDRGRGEPGMERPPSFEG